MIVLTVGNKVKSSDQKNVGLHDGEVEANSVVKSERKLNVKS